MIIKFKSKDTWVVYGELDHVEYRDIDLDPHKEAFNSDVVVYEPPHDQAAIGKWVAMGFFTKGKTEATEIIACTPIYLMNDQGRTIETI